MKNDFFVGMNIHNSGYAAYPAGHLERNLDYCLDMGINLIRYNNTAETPEKVEEIKRVSEECHKRGLKLLLCMDIFYSIQNGDVDEVEEYHRQHFCKVAKELKGYVDIYQAFNELDVQAMGGDIKNIIIPAKDGLEKGEYDSVLFEKSVRAVKGAVAGLKNGDSEAVVSTNFAWWHTAMIYEMYDRGCRFDIVGIDWYSDCEEVSDFRKLVADVERKMPGTDIMIYETNFWMHPMGRDPIEKQEALKVKELREGNQAKWVPEFLQKVYGMSLEDERVKGIVYYELLDESGFELAKGTYEGESHFGFLECDANGENASPKPVYFTLKEKTKSLFNIDEV